MNVRRGVNVAFFAAGAAAALYGAVEAQANLESAGENIGTAFDKLGTEQGQEANDDYREDIIEVFVDGIIVVAGVGTAVVSTRREIQATLQDWRTDPTPAANEEPVPEAA